MAWVYADRVLDISTTAGTGPLTVSGTAPFSWRTFSTVCTIGDTFYYTVVDPVTGAWETGDGTYTIANVVARTTVRSSSNAGALVDFATNAKNVFLDVIGHYFGTRLPATYLPLAGGTLTGQLNSVTTLTSASTPAINVQQTWNNAATLFTGIYFNATDTASNASSNLLNLQVGAANRMFVNKAGTVSSAGHLLAGATMVIGFSTRSYISSPADSQLRLSNNAQTDFARLILGGTTTAFPAIKKLTGPGIAIRDATDVADADITFKTQTYPNNTTLGATTAFVTAGLTAVSATIPTTLPPSGAAGGDLTGTYPDPTINPAVLAPYALDTDLAGYLPLTGGTVTGQMVFGTGGPVTAIGMNINKTLTGGTTPYGVRSAGVIQSDATTGAVYYATVAGTAAASFTMSGAIYHYYASQGTLGAGSAVTNQYGVFIASNLIGATNNYGLVSQVPDATGRWNLYMSGTAPNHFSGYVTQGAGAVVGRNIYSVRALTGATSVYGVQSSPAYVADVTVAGHGFYTSATLQTVTPFTLTSYIGYRAEQGAFGAGNTVTTSYGFYAGASLVGAGTNIGFSSNIAAAAGRYNFYAQGTAQNRFAGAATFDTTVDITGTLTGAAANFSGDVISTAGTGAITASAVGTAQSSIFIYQPGMPTDQKTWEFLSAGTTGTFTFRSINDTYAASSGVFTVTRGALHAVGTMTITPPLTLSSTLSGTTAAFSGEITAATPATADNDTTVATTAWVKLQGYAPPATLANYLPLTGGTLSGALSGTAATFSGTVTASQFTTTEDVSNYALLAGRYSAGFGRVAVNTRGNYGWSFQVNGSDAFWLDSGGYGKFADTVTAGGIGVSNSWGKANLVTGGSANSGYVSFTQPDGNRRGYLGFGSAAGTEINYVNDRAGNHVFQGANLVSNYVRVGGLNDLGLGGNVRLGIKGVGTTTDYLIYAANSGNTFLFGVQDSGTVNVQGSLYANGSVFVPPGGGVFNTANTSGINYGGGTAWNEGARYTAYSNAGGNYHVWALHGGGQVMNLNTTGLAVGTHSAQFKLDVRENLAGGAVVQFMNEYNAAGSVQQIRRLSGNREVSSYVNWSGQYLHENAINVPTRYSDFNTHNWRDTAGNNVVVMTPTLVTIVPPIANAGFGVTVYSNVAVAARSTAGNWGVYVTAADGSFRFGAPDGSAPQSLSPVTASNTNEVATTAWSRTVHGPGSSFSAVMTAVNQTVSPGGGWTVAGYGEHYDETNSFNVTTGAWTPSVAGYYRITGFCTMSVDTNPGPMRCGLYRSSSGHWLVLAYATSNISQTATWTIVTKCLVGETYIMHTENVSSTGGHVYGSSLYTGFTASFVGP